MTAALFKGVLKPSFYWPFTCAIKELISVSRQTNRMYFRDDKRIYTNPPVKRNSWTLSNFPQVLCFFLTFPAAFFNSCLCIWHPATLSHLFPCHPTDGCIDELVVTNMQA